MAEAETNEQNGDASAPIIIIDNMMIQHFLSKEVGKELEPILEEIEQVGATLAVSQIVAYEALKAIVFDPVKFKKVSDFFEKYLLRYAVDEDLLVDAARVHEIYGHDKDTKNHRASFSTEDIIIATTAMRQGTYVLTCDANDFPIPFFKEINRQVIYYEKKNRRKFIVMYLLEPDTETIQAAIDALEPPKPPKKVKAPKKKKPSKK